MKVKLLVSMAGADARHAGDEYECGAEEAARMIEAGFAEPIGEQRETATKAGAPVKRKG